MGSPGVFIHSGTSGGRLSALSLAPSASVPARAPAMTVPPTNAPPSRRNRRRDVAALLMLVGFVTVHPPFESGAWNNAMKLVLLRHKFIRAVEARQHGHRGKRLTRASMMRRRTVAIEFGT